MDEEKTGGGLASRKNPRHTKRYNNIQVNRLCVIYQRLGWRKTFIRNYFKNLSDTNVNYESDEIVLTEYAESWYDLYSNDEMTFQEKMWSVGFKKSVIEKLWKIVRPFYHTCYTHRQLYDLVLEFLVEHSKPIGKKSQPFFYKPATLNTWNLNKKYGYCINIEVCHQTNFCDISQQEILALHPANKNLNDDDNESMYLFHATSWMYAQDIIINGVDHDKGRRCLDFGIRRGFYTTENINMAISWGVKKYAFWNNEVAILVFKVSKSSVETSKYIEFPAPTKEWQDLVKHSRKCQGKKNILDDADFVYGPVCTNPHKISQNQKTLDAIAETRDELFQFVSKSDVADEILTKSLIGTLWMSKKHIH